MAAKETRWEDGIDMIAYTVFKDGMMLLTRETRNKILDGMNRHVLTSALEPIEAMKIFVNKRISDVEAIEKNSAELPFDHKLIELYDYLIVEVSKEWGDRPDSLGYQAGNSDLNCGMQDQKTADIEIELVIPHSMYIGNYGIILAGSDRRWEEGISKITYTNLQDALACLDGATRREVMDGTSRKNLSLALEPIEAKKTYINKRMCDLEAIESNTPELPFDLKLISLYNFIIEEVSKELVPKTKHSLADFPGDFLIGNYDTVMAAKEKRWEDGIGLITYTDFMDGMMLLSGETREKILDGMNRHGLTSALEPIEDMVIFVNKRISDVEAIEINSPELPFDQKLIELYDYLIVEVSKEWDMPDSLVYEPGSSELNCGEVDKMTKFDNRYGAWIICDAYRQREWKKGVSMIVYTDLREALLLFDGRARQKVYKGMNERDTNSALEVVEAKRNYVVRRMCELEAMESNTPELPSLLKLLRFYDDIEGEIIKELENTALHHHKDTLITPNDGNFHSTDLMRAIRSKQWDVASQLLASPTNIEEALRLYPGNQSSRNGSDDSITTLVKQGDISKAIEMVKSDRVKVENNIAKLVAELGADADSNEELSFQRDILLFYDFFEEELSSKLRIMPIYERLMEALETHEWEDARNIIDNHANLDDALKLLPVQVASELQASLEKGKIAGAVEKVLVMREEVNELILGLDDTNSDEKLYREDELSFYETVMNQLLLESSNSTQKVDDIKYASCLVSTMSIDSSNSSHFIVCGKQQNADEESCSRENELVDDNHLNQVRCCSGRPLPGGKVNCASIPMPIWAESPLGGVCYHDRSHKIAECLCKENGARLCTKDELLDDCAAGTGCSFDSEMVWSSTSLR